MIDSTPPNDGASGQTAGSAKNGETPPSPGAVAPATSSDALLGQITASLTDADLGNPTVGRMLVYLLRRAEAERNESKTFEPRFHEMDKKAAVLNCQLTQSNVFEIMYGVGLALGGALMGLSASLTGGSAQITCGIGLLMIAGAGFAKLKVSSSR